ncbi:MAG: hypothetical protein GY757_58135, partial [bacterium]|nr:hypothetical protein [bacterium]
DYGRYFSIFAPRQSGKTTFLKRFCKELEKDRTYIALFLSFEKYSQLNVPKFYSRVQKELYKQLNDRLTYLNCDKLDVVKKYLAGHQLTDHLSFGDLLDELNQIIEFKKIVIFIDEFDGIPQKELGNFLTTIRDLYLQYKETEEKALYSIGLVGIRNITKLIVGGVSPFNIADQVDLPPFSLKNVTELFSQYTMETNQPFSEKAVAKIHEETAGQPWLVNRLATILTVDIKPETLEPIDEADVDKAIQSLLLERNDHFNNLYEKAKLYKETFVEIVFDHVEYNPDNEAQTWLEQYGLVKKTGAKAVVGNAIYQARYLKTFFQEVRAYRDIELQEYGLSDNRLDMEQILLDFEQYITQIGVSAFYHKGAAPPNRGGIKPKPPYEKTGQFLLTAWLYQFVRGGGGELRYEVVSGLGRMDVILIYKGRKYIIETKMNRRNLERTIKDGLAQLTRKYLVSESVEEGYLVIFDAQSPQGNACEPRYHQIGDKKITSFTIAIGKEK